MDFFIILYILLQSIIINGQKIVLIIAEGLGGNEYHKFSSYFKTFEEEGVWSTKLYPVFPTLPLPNRHSLLTGLIPRKHGMISSHILNWRNGETFNDFTTQSDVSYDKWWNTQPLYVSAERQKARVAMMYFPECEVNWPYAPTLCISSHTNLSLSSDGELDRLLQLTNSYDFILVHDNSIYDEFTRIGPKRAGESVRRLTDKIDKLLTLGRERIDLNVIFVSLHGSIEVLPANQRTLDDYISMDMINKTVGDGALMQIIAKPGQTHQIYSQLRNHSPIPSVNVYYTAPKVGNLPDHYNYKLSPTVSDIVLIANPGYAIYTRDEARRFPVQYMKRPMGVSGYNGKYREMLGIFMAYGPLFRRGYSKGALEVLDIYVLLCTILKIEDCNPTSGSIQRVQDVLVKGIVSSSPSYSFTITLFIFILFQFIVNQ